MALIKKTSRQATLKFIQKTSSDPPQSMEVTESEDMPLIPPSTPPQSEPTDRAVEKAEDPPPPQVIAIDSESAPQPQPSTSQVEDEGNQEDTKRIKKVLGVQILKLLGRVVNSVKSMSEDVGVLNSKIDKIAKIAETSCLHYTPDDVGVLNSKIDKIAETSCLHYKRDDVKTEPPVMGTVCGAPFRGTVSGDEFILGRGCTLF